MSEDTGLPTLSLDRAVYVSSERIEGRKFFTGLVDFILRSARELEQAELQPGVVDGTTLDGRTIDFGDGAAGRASFVNHRRWSSSTGAFAGAAMVGIPDGTAVCRAELWPEHPRLRSRWQRLTGWPRMC